MLLLLSWRRARCVINSIVRLPFWELFKRSLFGAVGVGVLVGIYFGSLRVLRYMEAVELIGGLLTWKLTAMVMLTTLAMVAVSNVLTAMNTLYYAEDLPFLMSSPAPPRLVFVDKAVETGFYASWMVAMTLIPFMLALGQVKHLSWGFYGLFLALLVPYLALGAAIGLVVCLWLMYLFPSSRTRDFIWVLSSVGMAGIYVLIRFSEPERLANPQELQAVVQYLNFLQAPTAPYLPSWWMTHALVAFSTGALRAAAIDSAKVIGGAFLVYGAIAAMAGRLYSTGYSGAQEGVRRRRPFVVEKTWEERLAGRLGLRGPVPDLFWKDRIVLQRDVRYWSQLLLILALVAVYLFSIVKLPVDTPDLKSLVCFFNIATSGFVVTSLGLRFTFPAVSLEGKQFWVPRGAPVSVPQILREKFLFSVIPLSALGLTLVSVANYLLGADRFVTVLSTGTILLACVTLAGMGVGFGALFPRFHVDNVHQIESSAGGFIYMACALGYVGATLAIEALPVQMHFFQRFGRIDAWNWSVLGGSAAALLVLNLAAFGIPWKLGEQALESHEF